MKDCEQCQGTGLHNDETCDMCWGSGCEALPGMYMRSIYLEVKALREVVEVARGCHRWFSGSWKTNEWECRERLGKALEELDYFTGNKYND